MMKTIVWKGPMRELPGYGIAQAGEKKNLPDHLADSYVDQGLAEYDMPPAKQKATGNKETN